MLLLLPLFVKVLLRPKSMPVIAVDVDEVLANFVPSLASFHNDVYKTNLTINDFDAYFYKDVWGGSEVETMGKLSLFYNSSYFKKITPMPHAKEVLQLLQKKFDLHIVTARPSELETPTREWIDTHYNGIFKSIQFGNHFSKSGASRSKSSMCKDINAFLLIDDSYLYAKECLDAGLKVILFGDYPWNRTPLEVPRCKDWHSVYKTVSFLFSEKRHIRLVFSSLTIIAFVLLFKL
jgi:5'(3')-deoxyribonucleotidase